MKNLILVFVVAFAFCTTAVASDIAFYVGSVNPGWYEVPNMLADVDTIIAQTGHLFNDIEQFDDNQLAEFGAWVDERTDDGKMDIIWLNGCMPSVLYQFPNVNPDGSRAEEWLDGGNMIINVGDWFGYMSYEGGSRSADNGGTGAANILDLSSGIIVSADNTSLPVTPTGQEYLPSLNDPAITYRPIALAAVQAPWEVAAVFAGNATQADPVVLYNTETEGYIAFINQAAGGPSVWIDDRGLTTAEFIGNWVAEVIGLGGGGNPLARRPDPKDGAQHEATWVNLGWKAGYYAVSHDVYMGDNFDDVNNDDRTGATFRVNQGDTFAFAGFFGTPFPDGLVPGATYYWRIDEVNDANAASPWKGDVWSFWITPTEAYDPSPTDGSKFVDTDVTLNWAAGLEAKLHYIHFGDNFDDVNNAAVGTPVGGATFTPGTLEFGKTYYWRVDESNPPNAPAKGNVWSFQVAKEGGGLKGDYYHWNDPTFVGGGGNPGPGRAFTTFVLTRTDPQIDFNWGTSPDPSIDPDMFSARWTGEVEAAFTETYTFYTSSDDGARLWIDGRQLVDAWIDQGTTEYNGEIDLVAGESYSLVMEFYENGGGQVAELRWSSPSTPKQIIPSGALSLPVRANSPFPANGSVGITQTPALQWQPGVEAASHEAYFGTDAVAVANATKASPEYIGVRSLGAESYEPAMLAWDTTYYWRIDEVNNTNPDSPWVGKVWSFTTADFGIVEDFEGYNDIEIGEPGSNLVYMTWLDGYGTTTNGSAMGYTVAFQPTMETGTVHGGRQSAPLQYDNTTAAFSEAARTLAPQNWTDNGAQVLSLWFFGDPTNVPGQLYVKINGVQVNYTGDSGNLRRPLWQVWNIDLASVGTNLQSVTSLAIGIQGFGATGTLLLDDFGLYQSVPEPPVEIYLEAEAADSITPPLKVYNDPLASGGMYIGTDDGIGDENDNPPADGIATYSFTAEAGTYKIEFRVIITGGSNSFWVRIPGATDYDPGTHGSGWIRFNDISDGDTWHWDEVHSNDHGNAVVKITLPAGQHTLEIARREDGALLDAILITNDVE